MINFLLKSPVSVVSQSRHFVRLFDKVSCAISRQSGFVVRNNLGSSACSIAMTESKPKIVFVLGGPGAGKGTQCQNIVQKYGFVHLSAGDLLREERARQGSEFGSLIDDYIKNGKIVPVDITCSLLDNAIVKNMNENGKDKFLIDGFPRNQDNLSGWNKKMAEKVDLQFILFFDCAEEVCVKRCLSRGASGSGRTDDNLESMKKRIQTYTNESFPIIEHFKTMNLVKRIDASPDADAVFEQVQTVFAEAKL